MGGKALERYWAILDGEERARYLLAKEAVVEGNLGSDETMLWATHEKALKGASEAGLRPRGNVSLLALKRELASRMMRDCTLCERRCHADRAAGTAGHCGVLEARISSDFIHMGEEPELVPSYTIFFAGCTFNCVFCQNWDISTRPDSGVTISPSVLARKIEQRYEQGLTSSWQGVVRNVNWVGGDPTSNLPYILDVLSECEANIPQVWNSNMYLTEEAMSLLNGVVDVYLTDFKYGNDACAQRLSNAKNYTSVVQRNHILGRQHAEMIIRHLVLPGHLDCCTRPALTWISENLKDVKVNVMAQYRPEHRAREYPDIARPLRMSEYEKAIEIADRLGLDLCD